jgi:hypothetical protein
MVINLLRLSGDEATAEYLPAEQRIVRRIEGEAVGFINLASMYQTYLAKGRAERAEYLNTIMAQSLTGPRDLPEDYEAARANLRVKIWARAGLASDELQMELDGMDGRPDLRAVPIGEHLLAAIAYDFPDRVQTVPGADLDRWGVTIYEALETGKQNLADTMVGYAKIGEHVAAFMSGDSYDASRILLINQIRDFGMAGRPVALVVNRDATYVTGEDDEVGLKMMADLAAENLSEPYGLSGVPLVLDGDIWVSWMPSPDHPTYRVYRDLELMTFLGDYQAQKAILDALHERRGIDVFVATFNARQKDDGDKFSYCVWSNGVDTLLPMAQNVFLMKEPGSPPAAIGSWERVREVVGSLMEQTDHWPPRFRVRQFPDDEALEVIGTKEL